MKLVPVLLGLSLVLSGCVTRDQAVVPEAPTGASEMLDVKRLYESGEVDRAEELVLSVLKKDPDHKAAQYYLGLIWDSQQRHSTIPEGTGFWYPTLPMRPAK